MQHALPEHGSREVTRMSYPEKVLSRILDPGIALIAVGAVAVFLSERITRGIADEKHRATANTGIKAAGLVVAIIGAVLLFT